MKKYVFQCALLVLLVTAVSACKTTEEKTPLVHAHRGGMALYPENTIPAMIHAVSIGAPVLELDLHVSKDHQVVVSHDAYFHAVKLILPQVIRYPKNK